MVEVIGSVIAMVAPRSHLHFTYISHFSITIVMFYILILFYSYRSPSSVAMDNIVDIHAREILDSRGNPTVEVDLKTGKGM